MLFLLSLSSLGVRPGRKGREAWADYPKPLGGLYGGFWSELVGVKILYGSPKVLKMRETSAGMKTRRVCNASSAVEGLSVSKSFILLQAERGAMAGKYIWASSILPYVFIALFMATKVLKNTETTKCFVRKFTLSINKLQ